MKRAPRNRFGWRDRYCVWLLSFALLSLLGAFAQPQLTLERQHFAYLAVFDITQSMNVQDVSHDDTELTRLRFAKRTLREIIHQLPCGNELGVGIFTQHRTLLLIAPVEVCESYGELLALIGKIDWRMAWDARSEVAKGLYSSVAVADAVLSLIHI